MEEFNHILFHTIFQRLVLCTSAKITIAPIMFSKIQTSRYSVFQVSVSVDLNLFQNQMKRSLDIIRRQHIKFHVTEGGEASIPLLVE